MVILVKCVLCIRRLVTHLLQVSKVRKRLLLYRNCNCLLLYSRMCVYSNVNTYYCYVVGQFRYCSLVISHKYNFFLNFKRMIGEIELEFCCDHHRLNC